MATDGGWLVAGCAIRSWNEWNWIVPSKKRQRRQTLVESGAAFERIGVESRIVVGEETRTMVALSRRDEWEVDGKIQSGAGESWMKFRVLKKSRA